MNFSLHPNALSAGVRLCPAKAVNTGVCGVLLVCLRGLLIVAFLILSSSASFAQAVGDYRSNASTMNWSEAGNWEAGNGTIWVPATTYPGQNAGTGDVTIQDGHTVTIDVSPAQPITRLFVGEGASGILQYEANTARTLTVSGIVRINPQGTFRSAQNGTVATHQLVVDAGIVNNGILDFSINTAGVGITYIGNSSGTFDFGASSQTNLMASNGLVLNKGTGHLLFTPGGTIQIQSANILGFLTIQSGTFRLMGENSFSNPIFHATSGSYNIPSSGGFQLDNPNATVTAMFGTLVNNGTLTIRRGLFNLGNGTGNEMLTTDDGSFEMSGGRMDISGRFRMEGGNTVISGGTINLATIGHANQARAAFQISELANLSITGEPLITFTFPNTNTTTHYNDIEIVAGGTKAITGGTFQLGTGTPMTDRTFLVNSDIPLHNLVVNSAHIRVSLTKDLTVNNQLTLNGPLLMNNYNLNLGVPAIEGDLRASHGMIVTGTGEVRKAIVPGGSYTFPFGNASAYLPVALNLTGGATTPGATVSVRMIDGIQPQNTNTTNYLTRYWRVSFSGITNPVYDFTGTYATGTSVDIVGSDAYITTGVYTTAWQRLSASKNIGNIIYASGLTGDADITGINSAAAAPVVSVTASPAMVCSGDLVQLTTSIISGDGPFTYSWTSDPAGFTSTNANPSVNPINSTTYTVTVTDGMGVTATGSVTVTVNPLLPVSVSISTPSTTVCAGTPVTFTATPVNGGTAPLYQWRVNGLNVGAITSSNTFTTSMLLDGHAVSVSLISNASPCASGSPAPSDIIPITVNPVPSAPLAGNIPPVCEGGSIHLTASTITGAIYTWTGPNGFTSIDQNPVINNATAVMDGIYSVTATVNNCTSAAGTTNVTVNPVPATPITGSNSPVCEGGTINLTTPLVAGATYSWTGPNGFTSTDQNSVINNATGAMAGIYSVTVIVNGCNSLPGLVQSVTINTVPTITNTTSGSICGTGTLTLGASASSGTINWYVSLTGGTSIATGTSFTTPALSASTTYYVDATDNGCTTATRTAVVATVYPIPTIVSTSPSSVCGSGTVTLGASASSGTINWYTSPTGGISIAAGTSFTTPVLSASTTYYVDATDNGCTTATRTAVVATVNAIPTIVSTSPASICGTGTVTLGASASSGTINWYTSPTGGTSIAAGTSFTIPVLSASTTYYVDATDNGCTTATRTAVVATVYPIPTITSTTPGSICGTGSVTLSASASSGTINWYAATTGGTSIAMGTSFTTPVLSASTTYYVDATDNGCTTATRTAVVATVNANPTIVSTSPSSICGTGRLTLGASASSGTINWYTSPTGGTSIAAGTSFTTPALSASTTYYVDATDNGCTTATRTAVVATVYPIPTITSTTPGSRCLPGTVTLGATASSGTINWYASPTGGTSIATGTSFTTPSLSASTTYYVDATFNGCTTATRTAVAATINPIPTITSTTPASRCNNGIVTLSATASTGIINWYASATGGSVLASGTTYSPNITATTTFYVDATNGGCTTGSRTAITATRYTAAPTTGNANNAASRPSVTPSTSICPPAFGLVFRIPTSMTPDAQSYVWNLPPGFITTAGAGTSQITVDIPGPGSVPGSQDITVAAYNPCGSSELSRPLTMNIGTFASVNIGSDFSLCLGSNATLTNVLSGNATDVTWAIISGTGNITGGPYPIPFVYTPTTTTGSVVLRATTNTPTGSGCPNVPGTAQITVTVNQTPAIVTQPLASQTLCSGSTATFSVSATGSGLTYQWRKGTADIPGATTSTLTLSNITTADAGDYTVLVSGVSPCAPVTSAGATLTVNQAPAIVIQPLASQTLCSGSTATFSVSATGSGLTYQWRKAATDIQGATSSTLTLTNVTAADAGSYNVVVSGVSPCSPVTSAAATLTVNQVVAIVTQPLASQTLCSGSTATFSVSATGTGLTYQWRKGSVNIPGATTSTLTLADVTTADAGSYSVVVSGESPCSPITSAAATLTVNQVVAITTQPLASQTICSGSSVSFSVEATGSGLTYQWRKGTTDIPGATSATLTLNPVSVADAGIDYNVVVSGQGSCTPVTSGNAALVVNQVVAIVTQPLASQTLCSGSTATFSVSATGSGLTYQWRKGATDIQGATSATLTLPDVTTADAGDYTVLVSGVSPCSPVTSAAATLTVNQAVAITTQPAVTQAICSSLPVSFTVATSSSGAVYQWYKDGVALINNTGVISGVTTNTLSISNALVSQSGIYTVRVYGAAPCSYVESNNSQLTVNQDIDITTQPISQTTCAGPTITFSVVASGSISSYVWRRNGVPVSGANYSGANTATLTITGVQASNGGSYDVIISGTGSTCDQLISETGILVITPPVTTPVFTLGATSARCQGAGTVTYTATATHSTGIIYSLDATTAGFAGNSINASTGAVIYAAGWSGTTTITASAAGCAGPTITSHTVTVTPTVGTPAAITTSAGTEPTCQLTNATTNTTYTTTATNSTGFNWSISNSSAGTINPTTGVMTWANGFSGTVNIQVTANGCNGPSAQVVRSVTITPTVGTPTAITTSAGTEPTCQLTNAAATTTYTTTATNSTGFNWSISNSSAGIINPTTGVMNWANGFSGMVNIQVTASGCNGPSAQVIRTVNITPTVGTPTLPTPSATTICQGSAPTTYTTTATNATSYTWNVTGAGNTISGTGNTATVTWAAGFTGSATINVQANGCNGPSAAAYTTVTVTPTVGVPTPITIASGTEPTCQLTNAITTTTYATTATNSTGFNWSVSPGSAGTINPTTGAMTWANGFAGTVQIRVTANGCNGPSAQVIKTVTISPTVGTPTAITIASGAQPTCQLTNGVTTTTYTTTASNSIGFNWSVSNAAAGTIDPATGIMTWSNGFSGTVQIRVTANGCNGPSAQVVRNVTISPSVTTPVFALGATSTRCQEAGTTTYTATATNTTGISYSLDPASLAAGNVINSTTGTITYAATWSGTTTITVSAAGCNGPATATHIVTINPTSVGGNLSPSTSTACTTTNNGTLTLSGYTGTILRWESSVNAGVTWTPIANTTTTHSFTNLPLTTIFRAVVKSGACPEAYSALARVMVIPLFTPVISTTTNNLCAGGSTTLTALTGGIIQPIEAFTGGSFNEANPAGWRISENGGFIGFPANANNTNVGPWSETNGPKLFNGISYNNLDGKFAVVNGAINSTMETPVFNLFGLPLAALSFNQAYNLLPGTTARVELSTDGGNTYNITLATYTGNLHGGNPNVVNPVNIDLSNYSGMTNLRIRFNYISTTGSSWAVEGITIPSQNSDVTYTWSPAGSLNPPDGSVVTATPGTTTTYTLTMYISGCPAIATAIVVNVANPPTVQTTNACIGGGTVTFTQTGGTVGGTWSVSGGGTIVPATGVFTPSTPGCYTATYTTGNGACSDTKSFIVFPRAPAPVVNTGCGPIVITPPAAIPGFTLQYSFDNGTTWGGNTPPTADNCGGYQIRTRYLRTLSCDIIPGNTSSTITGCDMSPAVTRVLDRTPPAITCPPIVLATTNNNECYSTSVVLGTPVVTDNCSAAATLTISNNAPAQYPVGNTTVTWTATDACGNQSTCTQTVTVTDNNQVPVFTSCPDDVVQTALAGNCYLSNVVIPNPLFTDNCAVTRLTWTMTGVTNLSSPTTGINYVSGQTFNVGVTTVTYTAYDAAGNPSQPCSFDVWIKDLNKPVFTVGCPVNVTRDVDPGLCTAAITVLIPAVSDPCNELVTLTNSFNGTNNASGNYPVGTTIVTWTITDVSGNITTCVQTVTINDLLPTITCPSDVAEQLAADGCTKSDVTVGRPTFVGNCAAPNLTYILTGATTGSSSGYVPDDQPYGVGITTVRYIVTDAHNNTTFCSFTVTIRRPSIPPGVINCPVNPAAVNAVAGTCFAPVTVASPVEVDPCATVTYTFTNDFNHTDNASGSYPVGNTIVTWTIRDNSGNTTTCEQTVTVNDNQDPIIVCPASPTGICANSNETYTHNGTAWDATATDSCTSITSLRYTLTGVTAGTGTSLNGLVFNSGTTNVTWTATDAAGNTATCSYNVVVRPLPITSAIYHN